MRITVYIATSLDGFIARPDGTLDWLEPDVADPPETGDVPPADQDEPNDMGWGEFIASVDVLAMGRHTYEVVQGFDVPWPYTVPVEVLSRSLTDADIPDELAGKIRFVSGTPSELAAGWRERGMSRVYLDGGRAVQAFLAAGLVDELIITTIPVLIGEGIPLFGSLPADVRVEHRDHQDLGGSIVQDTYGVLR